VTPRTTAELALSRDKLYFMYVYAHGQL